MADKNKKKTESRDQIEQIDRQRRKESGRALLIAILAAIVIMVGFVLMIYLINMVSRLGGALTLPLTRT
jgi:predicted nucleic acid-binding Zn ribbon protein